MFSVVRKNSLMDKSIFSYLLKKKLTKAEKKINLNADKLLINFRNFSKMQRFNFSNSIKNQGEIEMPDHLYYEIPKYSKNPENIDFPWLIGGAPFLELKVKI